MDKDERQRQRVEKQRERAKRSMRKWRAVDVERTRARWRLDAENWRRRQGRPVRRRKEELP